MTGPRPDDPTLLTPEAKVLASAAQRYRARRAASRIAADCERMLQALNGSSRAAWRDAVGEALVASHMLLALTASGVEPSAAALPGHHQAIDARARELRERIAMAMSRLLAFLPGADEEKLILEDARDVRELATRWMIPEAPARTARGGTPSPAANGPDAHRARVLVTEDSKAIRDTLVRQLSRLGFEVLEASNGREGVEMARRDGIAVMLTDINMPELDGIGVLKEMKADPATRDIPVIVISSQDDLASVVTCIENGADDHISKPYEPQLLRARVRAAVERKRMRDAEHDYLRRVAAITNAAEEVEGERYVPGSLEHLAGDDALGRLARVFDRMVTGLRSREQRLERRVKELRREMVDTQLRRHAVVRASDESPFSSGEIIAGRYEILGQIGKGGMGMVYHARDLELGDDVAVKVVRRDLVATDQTILERLKSEIRLSRRISHRNVVRAYDLGESGGTYFISMEYIQGTTVAELLDRRRRLTIASTLAIGTQLAEALAVAHDLQIIHRDIKPANLLIDGTGVVKVTDFGIARLVECEEKLTLGGFIVGTPQYMAPEQFMGRTVDGRTDLFAAGVVLFECLSGRLPFDADSPTALLTQIIQGDCPRLSSLVPEVPPRLEAVVHRLLQFQAADRLNTAAELAHCLAEIEPPAGESASPENPLVDLDGVRPISFEGPAS